MTNKLDPTKLLDKNEVDDHKNELNSWDLKELESTSKSEIEKQYKKIEKKYKGNLNSLMANLKRNTLNRSIFQLHAKIKWVYNGKIDSKFDFDSETAFKSLHWEKRDTNNNGSILDETISKMWKEWNNITKNELQDLMNTLEKGWFDKIILNNWNIEELKAEKKAKIKEKLKNLLQLMLTDGYTISTKEDMNFLTENEYVLPNDKKFEDLKDEVVVSEDWKNLSIVWIMSWNNPLNDDNIQTENRSFSSHVNAENSYNELTKLAKENNTETKISKPNEASETTSPNENTGTADVTKTTNKPEKIDLNEKEKSEWVVKTEITKAIKEKWIDVSQIPSTTWDGSPDFIKSLQKIPIFWEIIGELILWFQEMWKSIMGWFGDESNEWSKEAEKTEWSFFDKVSVYLETKKFWDHKVCSDVMTKIKDIKYTEFLDYWKNNKTPEDIIKNIEQELLWPNNIKFKFNYIQNTSLSKIIRLIQVNKNYIDKKVASNPNATLDTILKTLFEEKSSKSYSMPNEWVAMLDYNKWKASFEKPEIN